MQKFNYFVFTVEPHYNEDLGTMKITFVITGFSYQGKKNTKTYKELGPAKLPCYTCKRVLLYPSSL